MTPQPYLLIAEDDAGDLPPSYVPPAMRVSRL